MPEGPEVKNLVLWLNKDLKNKILNKIIIKNGRYKTHGPPKNLDKIKNLTIEKISCHGKFIYWIFKKTDIVLFNTLGMSGWFFYNDDPYNNIEFKFKNFSIFFNDYRNFGTLIICNKLQLEKKLKELGPDILSKVNNKNLFLERINRKKENTIIGSAILDQKLCAGVGNYIRSESLYIAKLSPFRKIKNISQKKLSELWDIFRQIAWVYYNESEGKKLNIINNKYKIKNLYKKIGPSKYKPKEGYFLVYRQKKDPNGFNIISEKINNRTVHYVKEMQK